MGSFFPDYLESLKHYFQLLQVSELIDILLYSFNKKNADGSIKITQLIFFCIDKPTLSRHSKDALPFQSFHFTFVVLQQ